MKTMDSFLWCRLAFFILTLLPECSVAAQSAFDRMLSEMSKRAHDYPREKVFIHFDNTSYYQGDTIWFSALAVTAADNRPSKISRPLYVDMLDQLGNTLQRITVKLDDGRGSGYLPLSGAMFTGYYEVRAYTKWMLSFGDEDYFSRVIPVYRRRVTNVDEPRDIASYNSLSTKMKLRPVQKEPELSMRFYPEGGHLVQGVPSVVGFEVASADSGSVNLSGIVYSDTGEQIGLVQTLHDGRGSFSLTPGAQPARAELTWRGRSYSFKLPEARQHGYVLHADNRGDCLDVSVNRSSESMNDSLAVFVFGGGMPLRYVPVGFKGQSARFRLMFDDLPAGVSRLALLDANGRTLADRFFFVEPKDTLSLTCKTDLTVYKPNSAVRGTLRLTRSDGTPVAGAPLSVAVRDAAESDYREYDNTLQTDLLLTSDLRGYIDRPGFYFRERTARSRMLLDQLLLVRGWRRYNLYEDDSLKPRNPLYAPERTLTLYGQVKSLLGRPQAGIGVSFLATRDSLQLAGFTQADDEGYFSAPLDGFSGNVPTVIQTRREGKQYNRWSRVSLFRRFSPSIRAYDYAETHPAWQLPGHLGTNPLPDIQITEDSIFADSDHVLGTTTVTAKRRKHNSLYKTESFERSIIASYNLRDYVDRRADEGKPVYNLAYMLEELNPDFKADSSNVVTYKGQYVLFLVNGHYMEFEKLRDSYNQMESMLLYSDVLGSELFVSALDSTTFRKEEKHARDVWSEFILTKDTIKALKGNNSDHIIICSITMTPDWTSEKFYQPRRGIRLTTIQGYEAPSEYYSPNYSAAPPMYPDKRRTLYWNPSLVTDRNGEATINCWNNSSTTTLTISAEGLVDDKPASLLYNSY